MPERRGGGMTTIPSAGGISNVTTPTQPQPNLTLVGITLLLPPPQKMTPLPTTITNRYQPILPTTNSLDSRKVI